MEKIKKKRERKKGRERQGGNMLGVKKRGRTYTLKKYREEGYCEKGKSKSKKHDV